MKNNTSIPVYEHQRLFVGVQGFSKKHLDALLKLNEDNDFKYFHSIPNGIKFKHYVGIIQVDGLSIEIHPKADKSDKDDAKWQNVLLKMLEFCGKIKVSSTGTAHVSKLHRNLLEVYFELYLSEIEKLIREGLVKQYRKETSNTKTLKGKLNLLENIRHNLVHQEQFYITHQVYDRDHVLHQVLYTALDIVTQFSKGGYLQDRCNRLRLYFSEVGKIKVTEKLLEKIVLTKKTASYSYALELARLLILNYSPNISRGNEKMISLLFDMNKLWEEYILVSLRKELYDSDYIVSGRERKSFIGRNTLKPDIVIRNSLDYDEVYVIDTKWKLPKNSANSSDIQQLYAYARFWQAQKTMILYPGDCQKAIFQKFENTNDNLSHENKMGFVSVLDSENKLNTSIGKNIIKVLEVRK